MVKQELTIAVRVTFPANLPAGSEIAGRLVIDPVVGEVSSYVVPKDRKWTIVDAYVPAVVSGVDAVANIVKNGEAVMATTAPINALLVSNPSRPGITKVTFEPGSTLSVTFTTLSAVGSSAVSATLYLRVVQETVGAGVFELVRSALRAA